MATSAGDAPTQGVQSLDDADGLTVGETRS
jgi:hypothetical protein